MGLEDKINDQCTLNLHENADVSHDTHPFYHKISPNDDAPTVNLPLSIFRMEHNQWLEYEFPATQTIIRIGSDTCASDIYVSDKEVADVHIVSRLIGEEWHIFERNSECIASFNGIKKRHAVLNSKCASCLIKIKEHVFVFSLNAGTNVTDMTNTDSRTFGLKALDKVFDFPSKKPILIGANSACDVQLPGEEFAALISRQGNNFYLSPIINTPDAPETYPLVNNSEMLIGEELVIFQLPQAFEAPHNLKIVHDYSNPNMALLELDANKNVCNKLLLPGKGESIVLGRGKESYLGINSDKMSRRHCQIMIYRSSLLIVDNDSTNGTYINGERIKKKIAHPGDSIKLADKKYILSYAE